MAIAVPATPEVGRNFFPGLMKLPQPITQPKAMAHTCMGLSLRRNDPDSLLMFFSPV